MVFETPPPNLKILMLRGKELSSEDLEIININRKKEFNSSSIIKPEPNNDDWERLYFLIKDQDKLVAFGRLVNVNVTFMNDIYPILGIATIISIIKNKGYGKLLVETIVKYISESDITCIGFCERALTSFYKKCGFEVIPEGMKRFVYYESTEPTDGDAIYISGKDGLVEKMLEHPKDLAYLSRKHW